MGKVVWNIFRSKLSATSYSFNTNPEYGGPFVLHRLRSVDQPRNPARQLNENILSDATAMSGTTTVTGPDSLSTMLSTGEPVTMRNNHTSPLSLFSRHRRRHDQVSETVPSSERPRWIRVWFLTRPHLAGSSNMLQMLVPEYNSLVPPYTSFRGTLPLYATNGSRSRS